MAKHERRDQYELMEYARISTLYHRRRQAFFEGWEAATKAASIIVGSSAVVSAMQTMPELTAALASIVAIVNALALVVGTSRKATLHNSLARRWLELEGKLIASKGDPELVSSAEATIPQIEQDEPPSLGGLVRVCTREVLRSMGHTGTALPTIPLHQRLLAHYVDFQITA